MCEEDLESEQAKALLVRGEEKGLQRPFIYSNHQRDAAPDTYSGSREDLPLTLGSQLCHPLSLSAKIAVR